MKSVRRRRQEKKTDYKSRFALLKSGSARFIARKSNRYLTAQIVETEQAQDRVIVGISSKVLLSKGWPPSYAVNNLAAAYLTGFLLGKMALEKKIKKAIFDMGMNRNIHKTKLYSMLKGAIDSGLTIPHNSEALPSESEIEKNERIKDLIHKIRKD